MSLWSEEAGARRIERTREFDYHSAGGESSGGGMTSIVMVAVELFGVGGVFDSDWLLFDSD